MTTTIDTSKQPVFLGSWLTNEPKNGDDAWLAWGVFNGAADAVEVYATEAAKIRAADYSDFANPAVKVRAALATFAKTLLAGRTARYQELDVLSTYRYAENSNSFSGVGIRENVSDVSSIEKRAEWKAVTPNAR